MNLDKSEFKIDLARNWGRRFEEMETGTKTLVLRLEGNIDGLQKAAVALNESRNYYQQQVDDGQLTFEECKLAMKVIDRCIGSLDNLAEGAKVTRFMRQGELSGFKKVLDFLEKTHKEEVGRVKAVAAMVESGEVDPRGGLRVVDGEARKVVSAADDIAQRRAEAKAEKESSEPPPKKPKRKYTRRKKT